MSAKDDLDRLVRDWKLHLIERRGDKYVTRESVRHGIDVRVRIDSVPHLAMHDKSFDGLRVDITRIVEAAIDNACREAEALVDSLYEKAVARARQKAIAEAQATLAELAPLSQCRHGVLDDDGSPSAEAHRDSCEDANAD